MTSNKKCNFKMSFNKKLENFQGFQVFNFSLHLKPKTQKSWKVFFYFCQFDCCVTVIKSISNQKVIQPKGKDKQGCIQNPVKHLRWSFLQK